MTHKRFGCRLPITILRDMYREKFPRDQCGHDPLYSFEREQMMAFVVDIELPSMVDFECGRTGDGKLSDAIEGILNRHVHHMMWEIGRAVSESANAKSRADG